MSGSDYTPLRKRATSALTRGDSGRTFQAPDRQSREVPVKTTLLRLPLIALMLFVCVLAVPAQNHSATSVVLRSGRDIRHDTSAPLRELVGVTPKGGAGALPAAEMPK